MRIGKSLSLFAEIKEIPAVLDQKHYPSLNGLRGISIIMVVLHHIMLLYYGKYPSVLFIGHLGVDIFFVISGFLITTLCIKEKILTGTLDLKNFYIRRAFRILPVAFLYIVVIAILNYFFNLHIALVTFVTAGLFLANISYFNQVHYAWNLAHYWSLSTEEQFYFIFPIFIKKRFNVFAGMVLFLPFLVPLLFYFQSAIPFLDVGLLSSVLRYLIKFQGISIGCLFSILLFKGYLNFGRYSLQVTLLSIFLICYIKYDPAANLRSSFTNLVVSVCVGLVVINNISLKTDLIYKFLNMKALSFVGVLSYSIYIWQQLFLGNDDRFPLSKYPVNLIFLTIIPLVSYYGFEKYFLRLKGRYKVIKQKARKN